MELQRRKSFFVISVLFVGVLTAPDMTGRVWEGIYIFPSVISGIEMGFALGIMVTMTNFWEKLHK